MENQHLHIKGYRELSEAEINSINQVKRIAEAVDKSIRKLSLNPEIDPRWLTIAKTNLQKGFMSLTRAIAKPSTF